MTGLAETREQQADAKVGEEPASTAPRPPWSVWLLSLLVPAVAFLLYGSSGRDDAYITYWEADQLARTGKIVNYNDQALEQSSSLLHTLLLAAAGFITRLPIPTIGPWVAVIAGMLCVPVAFLFCCRLEPRGRWSAAVLVATLPPLVYWSVGGLETTLAALFVMLACGSLIGAIEGSASVRGAALATLGMLLVRPETGLVFVVALAAAAIAVRFLVPATWTGGVGFDRGVVVRRILIAAGATTGALFVISAIRKAYFGEWFPRPVAVKAGTSDIQSGVEYTLRTLSQSWLWIVLVVGVVVIAMTMLRSLTPGWLIAGAVAATGTVAVIIPGGDGMECGRLLVPWLAVAMVLVGASLGKVSPRPRVIVTTVVVAANVLGLVNYASRYSTGAAAWAHLEWESEAVHDAAFSERRSSGWWERRNAVHTRDNSFIAAADPVIAAVERVVAPKPVSYASRQAGMVIYYLQKEALARGHRFTFIDINGLTDDAWDVCRDGLRHTKFGTRVPFNRVRRGLCGPLPDVISGVGAKPLGLLEDYELVHRQIGRIAATRWPEGSGVSGHQWLAVRRDLARKVAALLKK